MPEFCFENALVLSVKPLEDKKFIVSLFTKERGRHLGVVRKKTPPMTASFLTGRWKARLQEQMGSYFVDEERSGNLVFLDDAKRLNVLSSVCKLLDELLPERVDFEFFYEKTRDLLNNLTASDFQRRYILWEIALLEVLGFGLDLSKCAGGGNSNDLAYVSPKTGRAVSRDMGAPYRDKLLPLPSFVLKDDILPDEMSLLQGLNLTGYFLLNHAGLRHFPVLRSLIV